MFLVNFRFILSRLFHNLCQQHLQQQHVKYGTWRLNGVTAVARRTRNDMVLGSVMSRLFSRLWPSSFWLQVKHWSALPPMYSNFNTYQHLFSPSIFYPPLPSFLYLSSPTYLHLSPNHSTFLPPSRQLPHFLFSQLRPINGLHNFVHQQVANHCNAHQHTLQH